MKAKKGVENNLGERLKLWRKSVSLTGTQVAEMIGISQGSLSELENNKSLPSADTLAKLLLYTNINILWLLTGRGPMKRNFVISDDDLPNGISKKGMDSADQDLNRLLKQFFRI
ncbi:MAG: helix-turn-helix domain-containing protein, partial [Phycisphaerae bacterium]|nr:helix-turn-helix domain-containing protein [Phycisphaerae bacterium]